jgi:GDP-L-fucose synthase
LELLQEMRSRAKTTPHTKIDKMNREAKIYVAGHRGLVGSAIVRALDRAGYHDIVLRTHAELDLTDQASVRRFFADERPRYIFLAAAKVGGILANSTYPAEFIFSARAAFTRSWQSSPCKKIVCSQVISNPRTALMPWQRSRESKCVGHTTVSTALGT